VNTIISFKNVSLSFGDVVVLKGLDLPIYEGEILTIIGGSGSGKSVTLKLLLGLLRSDTGDIRFEGEKVATLSEKALVEMRRKIGMVFQGAALFDSLSVKENVAYPLREHFSLPEGQIVRQVDKKLSLVGLKGIERMMPADLSGGMKKRVSIARAIATDPKVILYDEPTTGLDPANTQRINRLILQLKEKLHVTSVVVTHDMASAFKVSDRFALLHNGRIVFHGTREEILASKDPLVQNFIHGEMGVTEDEVSFTGLKTGG